ncbi:MAG: hypothetical protein HY246_08815, partial [Proteobacteria bacterium]|nr:hypothetical protein [Pseudomonadota bacterium]
AAARRIVVCVHIRGGIQPSGCGYIYSGQFFSAAETARRASGGKSMRFALAAALLLLVAPLGATAQTPSQWVDIPCAESMVDIGDRLKCRKFDRAQTGITESWDYRVNGVIEGLTVRFDVHYAGTRTVVRSYSDKDAERRIRSIFGTEATYTAYQSKGRTGWMQAVPSGNFGKNWKSCIGFTHAGPENHFVAPFGYYWDMSGYICRLDSTPITVEFLDKVLAAVRVGPAHENTSAVDGPVQPFPTPPLLTQAGR